MKLVLTSSSGRKIKELPIKATNFDEITSSPEALASWLDEHTEFCAEIPCDECSVNKECRHQGCDVDFSSNAKKMACMA